MLVLCRGQELARLWTGLRLTLLLALFLTQELENRGEIFIGVTTGAHHPVYLVGQGAERDRSLCVGGRVLCEAQILKRERKGGGEEKQTFIRKTNRAENLTSKTQTTSPHATKNFSFMLQ